MRTISFAARMLDHSGAVQFEINANGTITGAANYLCVQSCRKYMENTSLTRLASTTTTVNRWIPCLATTDHHAPPAEEAKLRESMVAPRANETENPRCSAFPRN